MQDFAQDYAMFTAALKELQTQLPSLQHPLTVQATSHAIKRVADRADSESFNDYINGDVAPVGQLNLAQEMNDNFRLIHMLDAEMRAIYDKSKNMQSNMQNNNTRTDQMNSREGIHCSLSPQCETDLLVAAAVVDGMAEELNIIVTISESLSLDTSAEEFGAYITVLSIQPFLSRHLQYFTLSKKEEDEQEGIIASRDCPI